MKAPLMFFSIVSLLCAVPVISYAGAGHEHGLADTTKGGRILENTDPRAEFYVEKDRTVTVTFYDNSSKPIAAAEQAMTVVVETKVGKQTVEFEKKGDVLVSKSALPEDHALNLVAQFKQTPDAKPLNFRFVYEDHICGACKRAEYACICGH